MSESTAEHIERSALTDDSQVWLIRHGETEWSRSGQHTGRTDLPLTELGERQALAVRDLVGQLKPSLVLCSPRQRAIRTAELAGLRIDGIDDDLAEWDYGDYEGLTSQQIQERVPGWSIWTHECPGGETGAQVSQRADRVLSVASRHVADGPVVLVAHGHMSRVLGIRWIGLPITSGASFALDTAAPSMLGAQHAVPVITHWNIPNPVRE
ncbi:probable phosphoglycerate mutase [Frankineae bacterium MT45]|nr:probable phosphoglycerate mutase [Frankineae bacterium MT45]